MVAQRSGLARRRAAMGFTQETLAVRLGVELSTVGRWERGVLTPQPWRRPDLARALELSLDDLVELLGGCAELAARHPAASEPFPGPSPLADLTGPAVVASIQATAQAFQTADRRVGGGALFPAVAKYLNSEIGPRLLDPLDGVHGSALFAAAASMTEIAGWMSHDGAQDDLARRYFDRAFRLATASSHSALAGNACASMAHLAVELVKADDALHIAEVGLTHARGAPGAKRLVARLHSMRARGHALQGDGRSCIDELRNAQQVISEVGGEPSAEWIAVFDEASLASEAALCFLQLAELDEAERHARHVIKLRSGDRVRSRSFGQLTLANVLVAARRVDEAAALGEEVCAVTSSLSSTRVTNRLVQLGDSLETFRKVPEVSNFLIKLSQIPTAQESQEPTWPV